jgi:hypothetical protein
VIHPTEKDIGRKVIWEPGTEGDMMTNWRGDVFFGELAGLYDDDLVGVKTKEVASLGYVTYTAFKSACYWADDL